MKYVLLVLMAACAWAQSQPNQPINNPEPRHHPGAGKGGAGKDIGSCAGVGGKDVAVGTVKGTEKIGRGIGKALKNLF